MLNIHPTIQKTIAVETTRLNNEIELIASENYPSQAVLDILGSTLSVKYAEGYPGKRHYAGCEHIDEIENLAISSACELFGCNFANVQPWSGSQANAAVYFAFDNRLDVTPTTTLSLSLAGGSHLTHGSKFTLSGKYFSNHNYELKDELIDYDDIEIKLHSVAPRLLILGYSAYTRKIDFEKIRHMVDKYNEEVWPTKDSAEYTIPFEDNVFYASVGGKPGFNVKKGQTLNEAHLENRCIMWCDMAHFAGYVAAKIWKDQYNPIPYCDVVTSTTHKTLRGPRGGLILWNNPDYTKRINQAVFPAIQGGPNGAAIAAKAQCFIEALTPQYKRYVSQIDINMQSLIKGVRNIDIENKLRFVTGGTENHMILIDVSGAGVTGKEAEDMLRNMGIVVNKNMLAGDANPTKSSGIRLGVPAVTTRGYGEEDCYKLGQVIARILLQQCTERVENDETVVSFSKLNLDHLLTELKNKLVPFYTEDSVGTQGSTPPDVIA